MQTVSEKDEVVNIVMQVNNEYVVFACITMYSIVEHTSDKRKLHFHILCGEGLSPEAEERLLLLKQDGIDLGIIRVNTDRFQNARPCAYISVEAYYKFLIPEVIEASKCIYIDADVLVNIDMNELYDIELDNEYVAGVLELSEFLVPDMSLSYADQAGLSSFEDYINTGVLLMNLHRMRMDHITDKLISNISEKSFHADQDIVNKVCHGRIKIIDWKYNYIPIFSFEEYERFFGSSQLTKENIIIHYAGQSKPWNCISGWMSDIWRDAAKRYLKKTEWEKVRCAVASCCWEEDLASIVKVKILYSNPGIVIWGASNFGMHIRNQLLDDKSINVDIKLFDNNKDKKEMFSGVNDIKGAIEFDTELVNMIWIITAQRGYRDIEEFLIRRGVENSNIIKVFDKERRHYI